MRAFTAEIRAAWRALLRAPRSTFAAFVICSVTIATAGTIFAVAHAVLLRPLPFEDPDRLVWVWATRVDRDRAFFSLPDFVEQRRGTDGIADLVAISNWGANMGGQGTPRRLQGIRATANICDVLGILAAAGRTLHAEDDDPGRPAIAMLSYVIWREQFGGDAAVVGRTVTLNDAPYEIAGILPRDFLIPGSDTEVLVPLRPSIDARRTDYNNNFLRVIARLHAGWGWGALQRRMAAVTARLKIEHPAENAKKTDPRVLMLQAEIFGAYRLAFSLLLLCGVLILLLTAANLAHLMLARLRPTARAAAVRLALGAPRGHVVRIVLAEPLLVTLASAAAALLAMTWLIPLTAARVPQVPRSADASIDAAVVAAVVAMAIGAGLLAGAIPAARLLSHNWVADAFAARTYTGTTAAGKRLLAAEIGLCLTLLSTALLALQSMSSLLAMDTGMTASGVMTMRVSLPASRYADGEAFDAFFERVLDDLRRQPDVSAAGATNVLPLSGMNVRTDFEIVGRPSRSETDVPAAQNRWVTPGYFEAAGIPILRGRAFADGDTRSSGRVLVVDAVLARQFWADHDPIGDRVRLLGLAPNDTWTIVGVSGPIKHQSPDETPAGTLYAAMTQVPRGTLPVLANGVSIVARGAHATPDALARGMREAVRSRDAALPISAVRPLTELFDAAVAPRRLTAWLTSALAVTALAIGVFGIAAVTASIVSDRRREFAIRLAVGASPARVWRAVLLEVAQTAIAGALLGVGGALALHGVFRRFFFVTGASQPLGEAAAAAIMLVAALAGALVPAWKAAGIDAVDALKDG